MSLAEVIAHFDEMLPYLIVLTIFAASITYYYNTLKRIEEDD